MLSSSRHGCQGGVAVENRNHEEEDLGITPYEQQRNRRKRELHDKVERALLSSGFQEATKLRPLFTGEVRQDTASGKKIGKDCSRCCRTSLRDGATEVHRSVRKVEKTHTTRERGDIQRKSNAQVSEKGTLTPYRVCMQLNHII